MIPSGFCSHQHRDCPFRYRRSSWNRPYWADHVSYVRANPNNRVAWSRQRKSSDGLLLRRAEATMMPSCTKSGRQDDRHHRGVLTPGETSVVAPHADTGELKLLAVTSDRRVSQLPNVPTLAESGFPGFKVLLWTGLFAPAGTAAGTVDRIAGEIARMARDPAAVQRLGANGIDVIGNDPQSFGAMIAEDISFWAEAVRSAGLAAK